MSDRYKNKNNKNSQKPAQKQVEKNQNQQTPITQPAQADQMQVTVTVDKKQYLLKDEKTETVQYTEKKTESKVPAVIAMTINHSETVESQQQVPTQTSVEVKQRDKKNLAFSSAKTESFQTKEVKEPVEKKEIKQVEKKENKQVEKKEVKQESVVYLPKPQLSEWQNNMFASIAKILKPQSADALMTNINSAARIYAKQETVESNVSAQDKDQQNIYFDLCIQKDVSKQNGTTVPQMFTKKLLGTTSVYNAKKDYEMKFRTVLNKYGNEELKIWAELQQLLIEIHQQFEQNTAQIYELFCQMLFEIYDKACMEKKYTGIYAKLLVKAASQSSYKDKKINLNQFLLKICTHYLTQTKEGKEEAQKGQGKAQKIDYDEVLPKIIRQEMIGKIKNELEKGVCEDAKYEAKANETPLEKQAREQNIQVHLSGSMLLASQLYLHDPQHKILTQFVMLSLLLFVLNNELKDIRKQLGAPASNLGIQINQFKDNANYTQEALSIVQNIADAALVKKLQLPAFYLCNLVKMLEEVVEKLEHDTKETQLEKVLSFLKNGIMLFEEAIIPSFIFFKIREKVVKHSHAKKQTQKNQAKNQQPIVWTQDMLILEWQETTLHDVLSKLLNTKSLETDFLKNSTKVLEFVDFIYAHNKQDQLIKQLPLVLMSIPNTKEKVQFFNDFIHQFIKYLLTHQQQQFNSVYKFIAKQFQDKCLLFDAISRVQSPDKATMRMFLTNIVRATVQNSFEQTFADSYEDLLTDSEVAEVKQLIAQHQYNLVSQKLYLVQRFKSEKFSYFAEVDAQQYINELVSPFDAESIEALKKLFQCEISLDELKKKIVAFFAFFEGQKITAKLYNLFDEIGFSCGIQAFNFMQFDSSNMTADRKMRTFILEQQIRGYVEKQALDALKTYIQQEKQIAAAVLERSYAYLKDKPSSLVDLLRICEVACDKKVMKAKIEEMEKNLKSYGLLKEVVEYGRKL
ncbi:Conserved_hypothetical protein [Hexamita inflata]|uniref:Uncharacterized protein n=1 Tax=Hexamita inflata TaxID=28002 RepID=A0AA86UC91_9EUKA|nr:Conserved hypothetical protein [Hexamita inflata]